MSRIGKKPIPIPDGVKVSVGGRAVSVEGPKGKLTWTPHQRVSVSVDDAAKVVKVVVSGDDRTARSLHGLSRSLISNMIEGCWRGFSRSLEIYGVGYGAQLQAQKLIVNCGLSHPAVFDLPAGISVDVSAPQARGDVPARFTVSGPDKQLVGEFAARVRRARPPEPYKGKGIRYADEHVRRKAGKAFVGGPV